MDGGFVVKFDGKVTFRCTSVSFDHDLFQYQRNNEPPKSFPPEGIKKIEITFEEDEG